MPSKAFICPSCDQYYPDNFGGGKNTAMDRSNFSSPYNLGYSISLPFTQDPLSNQAIHYVWGTGCAPDFALMADLNPGESLNGPSGPSCVVTASGLYGGVGPVTPTDSAKIQRLANSNNHYKAGQNVLYGDGHCEWHPTAFAGAFQDNIYTAQGSTTATSGPNNIWTGVDQLPLRDCFRTGRSIESCGGIPPDRADTARLREVVKQPLNGTRLSLSGTDSMMQPSQEAWQFGTGIGIE
jgi:prepilin-type processing-associated H-X9-DG protein